MRFNNDNDNDNSSTGGGSKSSLRATRLRRVRHQTDITKMQADAKRMYGFGYRAEPGDIRDFTKDTLMKPARFDDKDTREIAQVFSDKINIDAISSLPTKWDISAQMTPIRDQGDLGSCTAFSISGIVEYFNKTKRKSYMPTSPLYTYKKTRDLQHEKGDTGAYLRTTMRQLVTYGWVPEKDYPYVISKFDNPITKDLEDMGEFNQALSYVRVDGTGTRDLALVEDLKKYLSKDIPISMGFTVYQSIDQSAVNGGLIPFPSRSEKVLGGHAVALCGFDNNLVIGNKTDQTAITRGAFRIRNSWTDRWGDNGYGWLPYEYANQELAMDFWALLDLEWMNWAQFDE